MWLDRGELDKIIDRSAGAGEYTRGEAHGQHGGEGYAYGHKKRKKKESFLSDLFDFD